ncbi:MAG: amidohydrolase family protein [Phycisphaerae bacterium]
MIIDCHTHLWAGVNQLGQGAPSMLRRAGASEGCPAGPAEHAEAARCVDKALVFAYRCAATGAEVPNDYVAHYAAASEGKMLAVIAVDPADGVDSHEAKAFLDRPEVAGLTLDPACGNFHPADSRVMPLYEAAAVRGKCVFFNHGSALAVGGRMEFARPSLLEEIAMEFPRLTMVVASCGEPWAAECVALLGRRPRVFADIASLIRRPWEAYQAMVAAHQGRVTDKILFGSGFPFGTAAEAIEAMYRLHEVTQGTNLPAVPREALRSIIERRALTALGLGGDEAIVPAEPTEEESYWPSR